MECCRGTEEYGEDDCEWEGGAEFLSPLISGVFGAWNYLSVLVLFVLV